jgi:hypothetical protein
MVWEGNLKKNDLLEDLGVAWIIILKRFLEQWDRMASTRSIWRRIDELSGCVGDDNGPSGFKKYEKFI